MFTITAKNEVTKNGTIPKMSNDNFNWPPFCVSKVKMNIRPVSVRYLHFTRNIAMPLKNGSTDKYEKNKVMMIEYSIAFNVSSRLTRILSISKLVPKRPTNALATFMGLGINPFEKTCQRTKVVITCNTTMVMKVCLLILLNG